MKPTLFLFAFASSALAALPSVGPDYSRPSTVAPTAYRDGENLGTWKTAAPADAFARGEWWKIFADSALDVLETRALAANQDLRASAARVEAARAAAGFARSAYWPQLAVNPSLAREQTSTTTDNPLPNTLSTTYRTPLVASWEIDLFGRVRRLSESALADAEASAATFESVRLALTAEVAATHFSLRGIDREFALVRDTAVLRRRALDLVAARLKGGAAAELDVARAETELASAEADTAALANRRAALQNALAVLVGAPASDFAVPAVTTSAALPPTVPPGLPADLLERRPDIAAAERALAAANARIGVAQAAFFPAISLTGGAGFASGDIDRLFNSDSRAWSIGPSLYLPIFQGGRNRANLARSRAAYNESVALFRQRVLVAFREVQDALTATRLLTEQSAAQDRALISARRAAKLAQTRYDAGYVAFLEVIDAQRTSLATERASVQLAAERLNTSVALIKSLGGGWQAAPSS
jgi:multidrug efflux system outer membrane protein